MGCRRGQAGAMANGNGAERPTQIGRGGTAATRPGARSEGHRGGAGGVGQKDEIHEKNQEKKSKAEADQLVGTRQR